MYKKTREKINQYLEAGVFPGASFAFVQNKQLETEVIGFAQMMPIKKKLISGMLFDVASLTKVICTTTVVLQLVERKQVKLDDSISFYLPSFEDDKITIRHLLTHTSDITTYIENRDRLTKEELKAAYFKVHSGEQLGKKAVYTDAGTIILGFMLEELFQLTAIEIFQQEVLEPLQMKNSTFLPKKKQQIVPTENHAIRGLIQGETHDPKAFILAEHAGNAGLFTNLEDILKFVQMYLNKGKIASTQFLQEETILNLLQDHSPTKNQHRSLGWDLKQDLATKNYLLFHTGYTGTFLLMDILQQSAFIFLSNRVHPFDDRQGYIEKRDQLIQCYLKEKALMEMSIH